MNKLIIPCIHTNTNAQISSDETLVVKGTLIKDEAHTEKSFFRETKSGMHKNMEGPVLLKCKVILALYNQIGFSEKCFQYVLSALDNFRIIRLQK